MQSQDVAKDRHLHVRIGPEDEYRLAELARLNEMPEAQVIRSLIRHAAKEAGIVYEGEDDPAPKPRRKPEK